MTSPKRVDLSFVTEEQRTYGNPDKPWVRNAKAIGLMVFGALCFLGAYAGFSNIGNVPSAAEPFVAAGSTIAPMVGTVSLVVSAMRLKGELDYTLLENRQWAAKILEREENIGVVYEAFEGGRGINALVNNGILQPEEGDQIKELFSWMHSHTKEGVPKTPERAETGLALAQTRWEQIRLDLRANVNGGRS